MTVEGAVKLLCGKDRLVVMLGERPEVFDMVHMVVRHKHEIHVIDVNPKQAKTLAYGPSPYPDVNQEGHIIIADVIAIAVAAA
jgi:hypothetical protein